MTNQDPTTELNALTREHMHLVWQAAQMGGEQLNADDRCTAEAMAAHSEYAHLWGRLDHLTDAEITADGANPILHVTMHAVVESQIVGGDPPETGQTMTALERRGLAHHEAVHRVVSVLVGEIWHVMHEKRPFNPARYAARLAELLRFRSTERLFQASGHVILGRETNRRM
ncbi:MAG: hypothetical protein CVU38_11815 [Chloroflexi bacterium HGW-Chloroflexi-1]|nr:MAG: hypothetical protein CVU38_11815 [Chloroflexi bacterium HGW-Chloroflexi-1]